jgi:hypothetical protein
MIMFIVFWWPIMLQVKNSGAMIKDLNLQNGVKGLNFHICNIKLSTLL